MESIDTSSATGRMFLKIVGIFAEFERENLAEAAKDSGKRQSKRKPSLFGGKLFCMDCGGTLSVQTVLVSL